MFRTLYSKFLKWNEKVHSHNFLSNFSMLSHHSKIRCVLVGWFACLLPAEITDGMKVFSLLSSVKADFGSLFDWETVSCRHLISQRSVCLVSNYKVCFPSSIWPMISLLAWSNDCLCILTVHLLSLHYFFLSALDFTQFWSNPLRWFKWPFVLDAVQ